LFFFFIFGVLLESVGLSFDKGELFNFVF